MVTWFWYFMCGSTILTATKMWKVKDMIPYLIDIIDIIP